MRDLWKALWKKYQKPFMTAAGVLCAACFAMVVAVNAQKIQSTFNPNNYAKNTQKNENDVDYDTSIFGSDQSEDSDGLEMDEKAEEDYNLDEGKDENILNNQEPQDNHSASQGLTVADPNGTDDSGGGGNTQTNGNTVGVTNDGTGPVISGETGEGGTGEGDGPGTGEGEGIGPGTGEGEGEGGTVNPDEGGSVDDEAARPEGGGNTFQPDDSSTETVETFDPGENTLLYLRIGNAESPEKALMQHFYPGESPRIEDMLSYVTVVGFFQKPDGGIFRKILNYRANDETGGDYTVEWENNPTNQTNSSGYPIVGTELGTHTATIRYKYKDMESTIQLSYDIVNWQVHLRDFQENDSQLDGATAYDAYVSPSDSVIIDLSANFTEMYNRIARRTELNQNQGTNYKYVNKFDEAKTCAISYFGGWTDEKGDEGTGLGAGYGPKYRIARPTDEQIVNGTYTVEMYPTWKAYSENDEYSVGLYGSIETSDWSTQLIAYHGDSTTLTIPEGVTRVNLFTMSQYMDDNAQNITNIVFPVSLTSYEDIDANGNASTLFPNLLAYEVAADNVQYFAVDGILYDKSGKNLLRVPMAKPAIRKWSNHITTISSNAFQYVTRMKILTLDPKIVELQDFCFKNSSLTELTIPESVTKIGAQAFLNIRQLKIIMKGKIPPEIGELIFGAAPLRARVEIQVPNGTLTAYWGSQMANQLNTDYGVGTSRSLFKEEVVEPEVPTDPGGPVGPDEPGVISDDEPAILTMKKEEAEASEKMTEEEKDLGESEDVLDESKDEVEEELEGSESEDISEEVLE